MRAISGIGVLVSLLFLLACGGGDSVSPTATTAANSGTSPTITPTSTAVPTAIVVPTPTDAPPEDAILEIRVTDAPPEGVTKILLTVKDVEVNTSTGDTGGGWQTIVAEPQTFDLVALEGIESLLGSSVLEPGRYNQVRLEVTDAMVTVNGEDRDATVPSGKLRFAGSFDLVAGDTTVVTLDFDAAKSVVIRGNQSPLIKPVVKLLVRKADKDLDEADEAPLPDGVTPTPSPTATPVPTPTPTPLPTATPIPTATPDPLGAMFLDILSPESVEIIVADTSYAIIGRTRLDAVVSVNDTFAELDDDGRFQVTLPLEEGPNIFDVISRLSSGEEVVEILVIISSP